MGGCRVERIDQAGAGSADVKNIAGFREKQPRVKRRTKRRQSEERAAGCNQGRDIGGLDLSRVKRRLRCRLA